MIVEEFAPAKINLGLRILGKRPDGFHDILSLFQTVNFGDILTLSDECEPGLVCSDAKVPVDNSNLICRAEEAFLQRTGIGHRVRFELDKRIPMGAGLGGGSSDAAAALRALDRFHGTNLDSYDLESLGATLGSDVPFLVTGGTAIVSGRGEQIERVRWPFDFIYVIVFPGFGVSTAWAYGALEGFANVGEYHAMAVRLSEGTASRDEFLGTLVNDFEPVVFRANPILGKIKAEMLGHGAAVSFMSGSGSSIIALFDHEIDANRCAEHIKDRYPVVHTARAYPSQRIRP